MSFDKGLLSSARRRTAGIVEAESDPAAAQELADKYKNAGLVEAEHELTFAVKVLLIGTGLKWQSDVAALIHDRTDGNRWDARVRSQIQLVF